MYKVLVRDKYEVHTYVVWNEGCSPVALYIHSMAGPCGLPMCDLESSPDLYRYVYTCTEYGVVPYHMDPEPCKIVREGLIREMRSPPKLPD
jgi:hypothetical protein